MIYSARNIANAFIQIAKERQEFLTNMQVQKLVVTQAEAYFSILEQ